MESEKMTATVKAYKSVGMEGGIARWYDRTTRKDLPAYQALAARIAAVVPAPGDVLEVAPGPGFLSIEMAKRGLNVRAVDISRSFLEIAGHSAAREGVKLQLLHGDAAALPVEDGSVDFVVCRAAFKNFTQPVKAIREMHRVLRPGGTALLIDMYREVSMQEVRKHVEGMHLSLRDRVLTTLIFRFFLIPRAYPLAVIREMTAQAHWAGVTIDAGPIGFEAWMKKG